MPAIPRREFLRIGGMTIGGLAVPSLMVACSKRSSPRAGPANSLQDVLNRLRASGAKPGLQAFLGGQDYVAGVADYVGLGLVGPSGTPLSGRQATIWAVPTADPTQLVTPIGPFPAPWYGYRKPDLAPTTPKGINAGEITFDKAGVWRMLVQADTGRGKLFGVVALQVKPTSDTRIVGQKAIPSETPTVQDHHGVDPICTREPPCDMHKVTLAKGLTLGKPVCFIVATPRFCMSRTCGPNLEDLIAVEREFGDRATFIHAEVYRSDKGEDIARQIVSPTFKQWNFQSEPWLFVIDSSGTIHERFEGAATAAVMRPALMEVLR